MSSTQQHEATTLEAILRGHDPVAHRELLGRKDARAPFDDARAAGVRYFASGSNNPGEILGLAEAGIDVGVAIQSLRSDGPEAIAAAVERHPDTRVFVDSGAFSEVSFPGGVPTITAPIEAAEWERRLGLYETIGQAIGAQLYAVAPDCVAHQWETLERMATYAEQVQAVAATGAYILVPCQKGELPLVEFWELAKEALGVAEEQLVAAVPMMKDETSLEDYTAFLEAARPARVHLLGLGPKGKRFWDVVEATPSFVELMCDSVLIASVAGWTNGPNRGPRVLTFTSAEVTAEIIDGLFTAGTDELSGWDWTEASAHPSEWMSAADLGRVAQALGLRGEDRAAWLADPDAWLQEGDRYLDPLVELELEAVWQKFLVPEGRKGGEGSVVYRKQESLVRAFGEGRPGAPVAAPATLPVPASPTVQLALF